MKKLTVIAAFATIIGLVPTLPASAGPIWRCQPQCIQKDYDVDKSMIEVPADATVFGYLVAGNRVDGASMKDITIDGKRYVVFGDVGTQVLGCIAYNSPAVTLSSNNNMSYGTQAVCNFAYPVRAKSVVYSGPDDNHLYTWQADTGWAYGVASAWAGSHSGLCVEPLDDGLMYQWELLGYAQGDTDFNGVWEQFNPYPGRALKPNACADMV